MNRSKAVSKPTIIVFASPKGGVGKSTLCLALAGALAKQGAKVRILDIDQNQTLYSWYTRHQPEIKSLSVAAVMPDVFAEVLQGEYTAGHDIILIDVAGTADRVMLLAASAADLIVTPARLSEPDIQQATRLLAEVEMMTRQFKQRIPHQILVNDMDTLDPHYQRHTLAELTRLNLPRFATLIYKRAAYREAFMTGKPPHFADKSRPAVKKAVEEIDALTDEVIAIVNPVPMKAAANDR
jgi:chromosome partitioning protein